MFQLILLHFNHGLIHIVFNMLQKLHRIISMDVSSDHLRPKEEPQLRYVLLYSENLKTVIQYKKNSCLSIKISKVPTIAISIIL